MGTNLPDWAMGTNLPNPLQHKAAVYKLGVGDTEAPTLFGLANSSPAHHVVSWLFTQSFPKESSSMLVETRVNIVWHKVQTHTVQRHAQEAGIGKNRSASQGQKLAPPRFNSLGNFVN